MDSLLLRHPQVITNLNLYLKYHAKCRKGASKTSEAVGYHCIVIFLPFGSRRRLTALCKVPKQPNYNDCGIYLLHFVKTFFERPDYYCEIIIVGSFLYITCYHCYLKLIL